MDALDSEPMSGAEFKMHTTDGDKIHTSATSHLMELWQGVPRKFCGKLLLATERELERHKVMKAGSTPMSAKDLAAISFQALPQGKAEGGKLQTEQLKHYYLSIISRIDEMQEFHDYAEGLQWFMETNPDPEIAIRFLKDRCSCRDLQLDRHLGTKLLESASKPYLAQIISKEHHLFEGRASGLLTLTELACSMTRLTLHRMGSLLETMFKPNKAPVSKYSQLEASYNEYVEARSTLQRLDINLPSEVDSFLLQQMVQVLANRREMQVTLGIPLAQLTIDGFEQTGAIEALICDTITEINNSPGKYKDPQVANPRKPGAANPVTPAPTSASTNSQKSTGKILVEQQVKAPR